jgi:Flp pilus assembly protein TadD
MEIVDVGLKYKPDSGRLRVYRGVLLVMKGHVEQAEREFETARTLGPGGPAPDVALAMAWMQSGDASKAVDLLRVRRKSGAREAVVPYMLGIALMRTGVDPAEPDGAEAIGAFEDAIRLDPSLAGPRAELGKALLRRGDTEKAIEQLERATSLDPDTPGSLSARAGISENGEHRTRAGAPRPGHETERAGPIGRSGQRAETDRRADYPRGSCASAAQVM